MSRQPIGYGIDFGTSNSAVAIAYENRVDVVQLGTSSLTLPSQVYLHRAGGRQAGEEAAKTFLSNGHERTPCSHCTLAPYGWDTACKQYRPHGGCNDARLLAGVKHDLAKLGFTGTNSWAQDFPVSSLVSIVLARLKQEADAACAVDVRRLVLGHPVVFTDTDESDRAASTEAAFTRLVTAAQEAGFEEVELLPEPTAAILGEESNSGLELAVDFGGGTFDVAIMDSRTGPGTISGLAGVAIGGEILDGVLFEAVVGPALELDLLPNWLYNAMATSSSVRLLMADPGLSDVLARVGGRPATMARAILLGGHAYEFYRVIEAAKIALSDRSVTRLRYDPVGLDLTLGRNAFEAMIRPELERVFGIVTQALERAGVEPGDIDRVLLTGGSCQLPAFRAGLVERFGADRLEQRDAFTAVVQGLGRRAQSFRGTGSRRPAGGAR